jgi:phenylalanyl-tRNA synthetase alpha chain
VVPLPRQDDSLPVAIRERLGMSPGQKNVLVRVTIRDPVRSLRREEANALAQQVYRALHRGRCGYL